MTKDGKHVKWQNGVQTNQNGKPLPVLEPQIEGYEAVEASTKHPMSDIRDKLKSLVIKLQKEHGSEKFSLFTEKGERTKIETFPANTVDVKRLFQYTVREKGYKN
eukprot:8190258-Ditylum_brightwellii.AAC.1